jgi:hypothetical protein
MFPSVWDYHVVVGGGPLPAYQSLTDPFLPSWDESQTLFNPLWKDCDDSRMIDDGKK